MTSRKPNPFTTENHVLHRFSEMKGCGLHARDGTLGTVHDLLFDDLSWTVRYVVADTGDWLPGRKVLLAPESFGAPNQSDRVLPVELTKREIECSPPISADRPVSRELEIALRDHFSWLPYWTSPRRLPDGMKKQVSHDGNPNLRSCMEVLGYRLRANDTTVGSVGDLLIGGTSGCIRYLVVDVKESLLKQKRVLVLPSWVDRTSWHEQAFLVSVSAELIQDSPEFAPPMDRTLELEVMNHYSGSGLEQATSYPG